MKFKEKYFLILLIAGALFLNFFKLYDCFNLTGDPGRDAVAVRDIIVEGKMTLLGPKASAGGFYYGPWYFYLLVPFYLISGLNPIGGTYLTALSGVFAVLLMYFIGKEMFGKKAGVLSCLIYLVSPFILNQNRYAWNPSLVPVASLLSFWFFYKYLKDGSWKNLLLWGVFFGLGLHFHFVLIFCLPVYLIMFFVGRKKKRSYLGLGVSFIAVGMFFLPTLIFELRHDFITMKGLLEFIKHGVEEGKVYHPGMGIGYFLSLIGDLFKKIVFNGKYSELYFSVLFVLGFGFFIVKKKLKEVDSFSFRYLLGIVFGSLFYLGFYSGPVHPYYCIFLAFGACFIVGYLLGKILDIGRVFRLFGYLGMFFLVLGNMLVFSLDICPARTIRDQIDVARLIARDKMGGDEKINVVMFSKQDAAHSAFEYRYLVEYLGRDCLRAENYKNADKLYIVDEVGVEEIVESPVMEIRDFEAGKIEKEWVSEKGYKIYRIGKKR